MALSEFRVVNNTPGEPPYPATTRARGWMFELDYERIDESDTWALASPELRPWLLMTWFVAWKQTPCGTLPGRDELIAAHIGMPLAMFQTHRSTLMRGWGLHSDGRYYHAVVTEKVMSMLAVRAGERKRKATNRALTVLRDTGGTPADSGGTATESTGRDATGTGTGTGTNTQNTLLPASAGDRCPECPHKEILAIWAEELPGLPQPRIWTAARKRLLQARWRNRFTDDRYATLEDGLEYWRKLFRVVGKSEFLTGRASSFVCDLPWLIKENNFAKFIDGKYENRGSSR